MPNENSTKNVLRFLQVRPLLPVEEGPTVATPSVPLASASMRNAIARTMWILFAACAAEQATEWPMNAQTVAIEGSPALAKAAPADFDGDGYTDFAVKSASGIWYIDVAKCSYPRAETTCTSNRDEDFDSAVNDGCPTVGTAETDCNDNRDNDLDGRVNDGCPAAGRQCVGPDGYGGRWDFAYWGYGNDRAKPVPRDYGRSDGSVDPEKRADLAIYDSVTGRWSIDYADNGFGVFDRIVFHTILGEPVPADYDRDGRADLAVKTASGRWLIDVASDGFGVYGGPTFNYGGTSMQVAAGDYDGDGCADIAVKDPNVSFGTWRIDYARFVGGNCGLAGFTGWNVSYAGYGNSTAIPVPADYDGDTRTDIAIKDGNGVWHIDYASNGFGQWNEIVAGYGGPWSDPIPGHYELARPPADKSLDLSVKDSNGYWYTDLRSDGYAMWNIIPGTSTTQLYNPGRVLVNTLRPHIYATRIYGESGQLVGGNPQETAVELTIGTRYVADVVLQPGSGFGWDFITSCHAGDNDCASVEINPDLRVPEALNVVNPIGSSYAEIKPTPSAPDEMSCTTHDDCAVQNLGRGDCNFTTGKCNSHRRFAFTCTEPGFFALGFQVRNAPPYSGGAPYNFDYGVRVRCNAPNIGLFGRVTVRGCTATRCGTGEHDASGALLDGLYTSGTVGVAGATISVPGYAPVQTDGNGDWSIATATGGPHRITVTPPAELSLSGAIAINVRVPAGNGIRVDTPLEEAFTAARNAGIAYTMYIDYSRSRLLYHTLSVDPATTKTSVDRTPIPSMHEESCTSPYTGESRPSSPKFQTLLARANQLGALATINSMWWDPCTGESVGYLYSHSGYQSQNAFVWCDGGSLPSSSQNCVGSAVYLAESNGGETPLFPQNSMPLFNIKGVSNSQLMSIVESRDNFRESPSSQWGFAAFPWFTWIWDNDPRNNTSDIDYGFQIGNPPLVWNGAVLAGGDFLWTQPPFTPYDNAWARTAVGLGPGPGLLGTRLYLVVADAEGVQGGNGPTGNQLAHFFKDTLGATVAIGLDSGFSTEMVLKASSFVGATGLRHVNTMAGEDGSIQLDPYSEVLNEGSGFCGSVAAYLAVQAAPPLVEP